MGKYIFQKIASKLVLWLVAFSSLLTILLTGTQLYIDYSTEINRISASTDAVAAARLNDVQGYVEQGDSDRIELLLDTFLHQREVSYAAVIVDDRVAWEKGKRLNERGVYSTYPLFAGVSDAPVSGSLQLVTDIEPLRRHFMQGLSLSLVANGVAIFLAATFVFLMFQSLVTRHLESIARQIDRNDYNKPFDPIHLDRQDGTKDELELVVSGLNIMESRARKAIESLERNEQRLLLFFDSTKESILGFEKDGACSFVNDAALEMLEIESYGEVIGTKIDQLFSFVDENGNDVESGANVILGSIDQAGVKQSELETLRKVNGTNLQVSVKSYPVFKDGLVSGAIVFIKDDSAARILTRERELLNQAIEQLTAMVLITDANYNIVFINEVVEKLTGHKRVELLGQSLYSFKMMTPQEGVSSEEIEATLLRGGQWEGGIETKSKTGLDLQFYCIISPVFDSNQKMVNTISVCREISYELTLQQELVNAKKMEVVGRLSSSFSHEFGNPLFGVHSVIKDIAGRGELPADDRRLLDLAKSECERMREMLREFQNLYKDSAFLDENSTIAMIIREVVEDNKELMNKAGVECQVRLTEEAESVFVSRRKISLVLRNILRNSIDSMEESGGHVLIYGRKKAREFEVTVGDAGGGIKPEYQERIFEPFFSTKAQVEGVGLGLSAAYGVIDSLGGTITFESEQGRGTVFKVTVPVARKIEN
jgi:PAS domain S-box-containing protein